MTNSNLEEVKLLYRVIDSNLNRLKEGIRVIEDIYRFIYNNQEIATELKKLRHLATYKQYNRLIESRDIQNDVLRKTLSSENRRETIKDIVISNFKRGEEASRVLEEIFKIFDISESEKFKSIRYSLYNLETSLNTTSSEI